MGWYVELTHANGHIDKLYCTTRAEARELRRFYLRYTVANSMRTIVKATVRKTGES